MKWAIKLGVKILLSRLPINYSIWRSIGIFRHGSMDDINYGYKIFNIHLNEYKNNNNNKNPKVCPELGCGDSIASAVIAASMGIEKIYLVDKGNFACKEIAFYQKLIKFLKMKGLKPPNISAGCKFEDVLKMCNASYLTNGLESLKTIDGEGIDFIYSHSVLEHIRCHELEEVFMELYRITRHGGSASHTIDYQDHLSKALNNLRFPESIWESNIFTSSGFYTNRIPAITMHKKIKNSGFNIITEEFGRWSSLPTPRNLISKEFDKYSDYELLNRTSSAFLKKL